MGHYSEIEREIIKRNQRIIETNSTECQIKRISRIKYFECIFISFFYFSSIFEISFQFKCWVWTVTCLKLFFLIPLTLYLYRAQFKLYIIIQMIFIWKCKVCALAMWLFYLRVSPKINKRASNTTWKKTHREMKRIKSNAILYIDKIIVIQLKSIEIQLLEIIYVYNVKIHNNWS